MRLTYEGLKALNAWKKAGIALPAYDVRQVAQEGTSHPRWAHFGIGNIFRIFIGSIADKLLAEGKMNAGLTCVETFDYEVVDKIYRPHDNLMLSVILNNDGTREKRVRAPFAESVKADCTDPAEWARLKEIFTSPTLQMVSFTITEKGYALTDADGDLTPAVQADLENGPEHSRHAMTVLTEMLFERFKAGRLPLALVSMDNCSENGKRLRDAVLTIAEEWCRRGFVPQSFVEFLQDEKKIAFPWTMIDKITPRPSTEVAADLAADGVEDVAPLITSKKTFIAPFGNAERAQYLVVEDHFPNGRPPLADAGVYMTDRDTVSRSEKMKVNTCLNPIHTALCTYDCLLGYELFADGMKDPQLARLAHRIGYVEGLPVVTDPGILSPKAFLDEVINVRMSNPYLGDTAQRIATDISQMVGIRFGETIKTYVKRDGSAEKLTGIALAITGWLRYLLAKDDAGRPMPLAPDPMIPELQAQLATADLNDPESISGALYPILSNENIFGVNLYKAGIGKKIENMFKKETEGDGSVRKTLKYYLPG